jgi:5-methylcytosine-specific restriction endonuclease McrA
MIDEKEKWRLIKSLLDGGQKPVDIARRLKFVSAQQIYAKRAAWKKAEAKKKYKADKKYHTPEYKAWRIAVFKRDGFKCRWCKSTRQLEADHIKPQSAHPELRFVLSNGRTLCKKCHKKTVTYGFKALAYKKKV